MMPLLLIELECAFSKNKITDAHAVLTKERQIEIQYIYTDGSNIFITGNRKMPKILGIFTLLFIWQCVNHQFLKIFI